MSSPHLEDAIPVALVQQFLSVLLLSLSTDHDALWVWLYTMCAFWVGTGVIAIRRRGSPTRLDVGLVKWGFVPLLLVAGYIAALVWRAQGRA